MKEVEPLELNLRSQLWAYRNLWGYRVFHAQKEIDMAELYCSGKTLQQVGEVFGVTKHTIATKFKRMLRKMRHPHRERLMGTIILIKERLS